MHRIRPLLASAALVVLAACSGSKSASQPAVDPPPAGQEVTVEVHPSSAWVQPGGTVNFASTVTGTTDTSVVWSVVEPGGGSISESGVYTAPLTSGTYTVTATNGKGKALGRSKVTVNPTPVPTVSISPTAPTVAAGGSVAFTATVTGTTSAAVTWSVREASGCGSIDAAGVYTAPAAGATCHVDVASVEAPSATASASVTVSPPPAVVAVAISPKAPTVAAGGSVAFTATVTGTTNVAVTWSVREASGCGSINAAGVYTAPAAGATCHVDVASVDSPSATASATVTVTPPAAPAVVAVAISPSTGAVDTCRTLTFTATVTGAANGSVAWSVQEGSTGGSITSAGVYTAPANAGTYHVVATSQAAPGSSATVPVTVGDRILGVAVSPSTVSLAPGATAQFTATVTTTCGSYTSTQTVTAPN